LFTAVCTFLALMSPFLSFVQEAARKAEEERLAREAAEKKAAEEAKEEKKLREKEKKMVRKERQRLRAAAEGVAGIGKALTVDELEEVSTGFGLEGLRRVCDELEGAGSHDGKVVALRRALQRLKDPQAEPEAGSSATQAAKAKGEEAGTGTSGKGEGLYRDGLCAAWETSGCPGPALNF
jgi:hypothetical protein